MREHDVCVIIFASYSSLKGVFISDMFEYSKCLLNEQINDPVVQHPILVTFMKTICPSFVQGDSQFCSMLQLIISRKARHQSEEALTKQLEYICLHIQILIYQVLYERHYICCYYDNVCLVLPCYGRYLPNRAL